DLSSNSNLSSIWCEDLTKLQTFSLYSTSNLSTVTLTNLAVRSVTITNSKLSSIFLSNLQYLTSLDLSSNPLLTRSILLNELPNVLTLDLSNCQFDSFPEEYLILQSLTTLKLNNNKLTSLPLTISDDLSNLKYIYLERNQFTHLPQPPLVHVKELYMTDNLLTNLNGISGYKSLEKLVLNYNLIGSIPVEIVGISNTLMSLTMTNNPLKHVANQFANMRRMQLLDA
ncbi:unnamed protein product, partial [Didymodactylos carnosus]